MRTGSRDLRTRLLRPGVSAYSFRGDAADAAMDRSDTSDRELLSAWRAGHRDAGHALVERHYAAVFGFFFGKVPSSACEDLTQQTFEIVVRRRAGFRGEGTFRAFLFGVARFVLIGWVRRRRPFEPAEDSLIADPNTPSLAGLLADQKMACLVATALRSLPLDDQILIELKHWESLTQAELAVLFAVPQPTVARRLQRATARLREAVNRLVADPHLGQLHLRNLDSCMRSIRVEIEARWRKDDRR